MLGLVAFTPGAAVAAPATVGQGGAAAAAPGAKPAGPNPFLSLRPNVPKADYAAWMKYLPRKPRAQRLKALTRPSPPR